MDSEKRAKIDAGIESCKKMERTFAALRATLEIAKACEDIELIPEQLNAIAEETKKAKASVTDINEARKATKQ